MTGFGFVSLDWLLWMGLTTMAFWATPSFRMRFLVALTFFFLSVHDFHSSIILLVLTLFTYGITRTGQVSGKRAGSGVAAILLLLLYYKIQVAQTFAEGFEFIESVVPLGISYYTLRCIHYVIERYKGTIPPQGLEDLAGYLFFLPTIWVGPIHRFEDFKKDKRRHRWDPELFSRGLERILFGYAKVVIVGNLLLNQVFAEWASGFAGSNPGLEMYLEMVRIGLTLYMLFSGYSDIAIGFGFLLGFQVMENFKNPYLQKNISDFWRCWHISLTSWCREYIYTSVIARTRNPALGVVCTLVVIGLWHEVSVRYLLWGLYHGLGVVVWQQSKKIRAKLPRIHSKSARVTLDGLSILLTVHFVWLGFILVRQPDIASMLSVLKTLFLTP